MLEICDNASPLIIYWEETVTTALQQSEALRQCILKKAFEGKLVEQNPKDEPALKLLERLKVERKRVVTKNTTRQNKNPEGMT